MYKQAFRAFKNNSVINYKFNLFTDEASEMNVKWQN